VCLCYNNDLLGLQEIYKYASILDLSRVYTNNIHYMAEHYGIEAAYQAIIKVSKIITKFPVT
jgi:DNA-directed RNA polymerase I subunit RPA1